MSIIKFAETYNLVAFLEKPAKSEGFEQIDSTKVKIVNEDVYIRALIDGKKIIVTEASIRRDLSAFLFVIRGRVNGYRETAFRKVEGTFPDGTKLITIHDQISSESGNLELALHGSFLPIPSLEKFPIIEGDTIPGELILRNRHILLNSGREAVILKALMNEVFMDYMRKFVLVFFDDILIYSDSLDSHLQHLRIVFETLKQHKLFVKKSKCSFGQARGAQERAQLHSELVTKTWCASEHD
nr:urease isoform X1 [Tanacetum cinerariifolium]